MTNCTEGRIAGHARRAAPEGQAGIAKGALR